MMNLRHIFVSFQALLWTILSLTSALVIATGILYAAGLTMFPADALVFLCAAAILFTRGLADHRVAVSRVDSLACPSTAAALEAGFAHLIHATLAVLTFSLSYLIFNGAGDTMGH